MCSKEMQVHELCTTGWMKQSPIDVLKLLSSMGNLRGKGMSTISRTPKGGNSLLPKAREPGRLQTDALAYITCRKRGREGTYGDLWSPYPPAPFQQGDGQLPRRCPENHLVSGLLVLRLLSSSRLALQVLQGDIIFSICF